MTSDLDSDQLSYVLEGDDLRDKKILSLAKKSRNLTVSLNKEKALTAQLTAEVADLKKQIAEFTKVSSKKQRPSQDVNNIRHICGGDSNNIASGSQESTEEEIEQSYEQVAKQYKSKLEKSQLKIQELRESSTKLKGEIARLKMIIQREVGEEVNIDSIIHGTKESWKGRAQQIVLLKTKNRELQKQLDEEKSSREFQLTTSNNTTSSELRSTTSQNMSNGQAITIQLPPIQKHTAEEKQQELIEKLEKERKQEASETKKLLSKKQEENATLKRKYDALQARNKILEQTTVDLKNKLMRLLEKTENDDKFIELLKNELENVQKQMRSQAAELMKIKQSQKEEEEEEYS